MSQDFESTAENDNSDLTVKKEILRLGDWQVGAFIFLPDPKRPIKKALGIFSHGYTSHKGTLLTWASRLAFEGMPCIIFDLPGHYLGSFNEVEDFEEFKQNSHLLFEVALNSLQEHFLVTYPLYADYLEDSEMTYVTGGHSLGALLSIKALTLASFKLRASLSIAVGLGLTEVSGGGHIFETPFYKSTLNLRRQLVSPALAPVNVFGWIQNEKKNISVTGLKVHIIVGQDDLVAGPQAANYLKVILESKGNQVSLETPTRLPHHMPELAASLIKRYLRQATII